MREYAVLVSPATNKVYTNSAARLMRREIEVLDHCLLDCSIGDYRETSLGGVPYLVFRADAASVDDIRCLSNVSSLYALFELRDGLLKPVAVDKLDRYDTDLTSILKYIGKTNEHFTKLLLNVTTAALGSQDRFMRARLKVLDPMCGRGTTLNQAAMYGYDAYGMDVDKRDYEAYGSFIARWLKDKSIKHRLLRDRIRREHKIVGPRLHVEFAEAKDRYRAGDTQILEMVCADTLRGREVYKRETFDLIVTDAPYGVQHGATRPGTAPSRSPTELLSSAIPVWSELLKRGGALGMSWNTYVTGRDELAGILTRSGLEILDAPPFAGFAHRVDQAINRDLIVARKPAGR